MTSRGAHGLLVTLGVVSAVGYAAASPVPRWLAGEPLAAHVVVVGLLFTPYLAALWLVRRGLRSTPGTLAAILSFALLFRLVMIGTPVYLSSDLYRYLWDGRVQLAGISPYRYPPAAPELAPLRDPVIHPHINRPTAVTVYPPGAQWLFALAALITPSSVPGWRLMLLGIEVLAVVLLLRILRALGSPETVILAYAWSPMVVFEGIQAAHVDLAVIPVILLALIWRAAGSSALAGVVLGLAVLLKLYPAVLVAAWWRPGDWRFPSAVGATVAAGYLPYAVTLGSGALGFLPEYLGAAEDHNIGLRALLTYPLGFVDPVVRGVAIVLLFGLLAAVVVWIGWTKRDDAAGLYQATALAVGAYLVLVPTSMHPWYVLWMIPFLCVRPSPAWLYFSGAVALSYVSYVAGPSGLPWWAWLGQYGPLFALLGASGYRFLAQRMAGTVAVRTT